jgi:recombination protein RecT
MVNCRVSDKGLIDLAHRSGEFQVIYAKEVYENDEFDYEYGLDPKLTHKPCVGEDRGEVAYYYAVYRLVNGGFGFEVMSRSDVISHAKKFSQAYSKSYSPWSTNFDEMAKKTVLKKVLKYAPIKTEFVRAITQDHTIKTELAPDMSDIESRNIFEGEYEEIAEVNEEAAV